MQDHLAIPVLYASSWLLTAFASDFPIFFASRVMDIILTDRYVVAIMKVLSRLKRQSLNPKLQPCIAHMLLCATFSAWRYLGMCICGISQRAVHRLP